MSRLSRTLGQEKVAGYVFIAPFIIGLVAFTIIPSLLPCTWPFTDYNVLTAPKWNRLWQLPPDVFEDKYFLEVLLGHLQVSPSSRCPSSCGVPGVALIPPVTPAPPPCTGRRSYIPSLMGGSVAIALTWKQLFSYNGAINKINALFGMAPVKWLSNPGYRPGACWILLGVWQFGSSMLIFLAALKNIPQSYHEAAIVDGAGPVRRFFKIVLPMITPIFFFNLINQTIGAFQAFNSSYLITQGKPLNTTLYYGVHLYNRAFTYYEMGYGSAMAWFMLLVIACFTALIFRSSSAWVYYESEGK